MSGARGPSVPVIGVHLAGAFGGGPPVVFGGAGFPSQPHPPERWLLDHYRRRRAVESEATRLIWFWERTEPVDRRRLLFLVAHAVAPHSNSPYEWIEASIPRPWAWRIDYAAWCERLCAFDGELDHVDGLASLEPSPAEGTIGDVAVVCDRFDPAWIERTAPFDLGEFAAVGLPLGDSGGATMVVDPPASVVERRGGRPRLLLTGLDPIDDGPRRRYGRSLRRRRRIRRIRRTRRR